MATEPPPCSFAPLLDATPASIFASALSRLASMEPPHASNFRVLCVWLFGDRSGQLCYATGQNTESCWMHHSLCAERSCLVKLRDHPDGHLHLRQTHSIFIVSDSTDAITPGLLCREMLSSFIPLATPIHLGWKAHPTAPLQMRTVTLLDLFPCPPLYRGCRPADILARFPPPPAPLVVTLPADVACPPGVTRSSVNALLAAVVDQLARDTGPWHFLHLAAGVTFSDGSLFATHQSKCVEYSCTVPVDAKVFSEIERRQALGQSVAGPLVLLDHLGTLHAPCAQTRAQLAEHGWGALPCLVHAPAPRAPPPPSSHQPAADATGGSRPSVPEFDDPRGTMRFVDIRSLVPDPAHSDALVSLSSGRLPPAHAP